MYAQVRVAVGAVRQQAGIALSVDDRQNHARVVTQAATQDKQSQTRQFDLDQRIAASAARRVRATVIGIAANAVLAAVKIIAGVLGNPYALIVALICVVRMRVRFGFATRLSPSIFIR